MINKPLADLVAECITRKELLKLIDDVILKREGGLSDGSWDLTQKEFTAILKKCKKMDSKVERTVNHITLIMEMLIRNKSKMEIDIKLLKSFLRGSYMRPYQASLALKLGFEFSKTKSDLDIVKELIKVDEHIDERLTTSFLNGLKRRHQSHRVTDEIVDYIGLHGGSSSCSMLYLMGFDGWKNDGIGSVDFVSWKAKKEREMLGRDVKSSTKIKNCISL